jgi:2-keto-4-pentenoate hydratase/2-oxohepta-3-ene-1,7-dioic acid hydratase in catechol pathway
MRLANVLFQGQRRLALETEEGVRLVNGPSTLDEALADSLLDRLVPGELVAPQDLGFLPVVLRPEKIICVGRNYLAHVQEARVEVPAAPCLFAKFPSSLNGHRAPVAPPKATSQLDYEGELAVVIGRGGRHIPEQEALDHVLGYTAANDVTARDLQHLTPQWLSGKGPDGFLPLGPFLVTADEVADPSALRIITRLNGEVVQDASTAQMIFSLPYLIHYISTLFTLRPGDLLLTGTPEGVQLGKPDPRWLREGDVVEVDIPGVTRLENVIAAPF